jgi:hypothetical protein
MPDKEPVPEYHWAVRLRDGGALIRIQAAYVQEGFGATTSTTAGTGLIVLKDGTHKTVFTAPFDQVMHVQREEPASGPSGKNAIIQVPGSLYAAPGQLRDFQDAVNAAIAEGAVKVTFLPSGSKVLPSG